MLTLLYSGNLGRGQDIATVLRAVARLNGTANLRLLIVGGGVRLSATKQLAVQLQLPKIEFRKPVPLYKLPELLAEGDIHIVCQKPGTEGLLVPSKIYSTLLAGRPMLFVGPSNCEAAQIVRESRSGFVIEPGDTEAAMDALMILQQSPTAREERGLCGRAYYEALFGRARSVSRLVGILEAVGNGSNGYHKYKRDRSPLNLKSRI